MLYVVLSVRVRSMCCGNVQLANIDSRDGFMVELRDLLGESFKSMGIVERSSFVLRCELWEEKFESLL